MLVVSELLIYLTRYQDECYVFLTILCPDLKGMCLFGLCNYHQRIKEGEVCFHGPCQNILMQH